jgi:hypothetical protein
MVEDRRNRAAAYALVRSGRRQRLTPRSDTKVAIRPVFEIVFV